MLEALARDCLMMISVTSSDPLPLSCILSRAGTCGLDNKLSFSFLLERLSGVVGARSVKWLQRIELLRDESQGFFMQRDYKMFPPSVDWNNVNWPTRRPIMDYPIQVGGGRMHGGSMGR